MNEVDGIASAVHKRPTTAVCKYCGLNGELTYSYPVNRDDDYYYFDYNEYACPRCGILTELKIEPRLDKWGNWIERRNYGQNMGRSTTS